MRCWERGATLLCRAATFQILPGPSAACLAHMVWLLCCSAPSSILVSPGTLIAAGRRRQRASTLRNHKNLGVSVALSISLCPVLKLVAVTYKEAVCISGLGCLAGMAWDLFFMCCWELISYCGQSPVALLLAISKSILISVAQDSLSYLPDAGFEIMSHAFCCCTICKYGRM